MKYQSLTKNGVEDSDIPSSATVTINKVEHIYKNITGWMTFERFYADMVKRFPSGSRFCEVGTYSGMSFAYLAVEMINVGKVFELNAIDSYTFIDEKTNLNIMDQLIQNMSPIDCQVSIIKEQSWAAADMFEDKSVQFLMLDADHVYGSVKKDILSWLPKMAPNSIISGHDYCDPRWWDNDHPGVAKAVHEIFGDDWNKTYLEEKVWAHHVK